ncbi:MAG: chromate efflux transporter [Burkholderiaceae bacterium]|nr:chromate efflux transporter [Burkholderiales bacterium]MCZ8108707.1 chromate efflux transporter [Burkholderiales bacterium]MCZ8341121.1 chromate efflux transporter [Burkholderiaceae bacterium]
MSAGTPSGPAADAGGAPAPIPFGEALRFWLKLGFVSFGGPAGQIAIMHEELVERRRWISEGRFLHALNYCMVLPGPEAQQLATYIGWLMHRTAGGLVAGGLFVLPSLFVLIALSWVYLAFGDVPAVGGVLAGVKPAVIAIVAAAGWRIASRSLKHPAAWAIALAAFVATVAFDVPFPAIVFVAAALGVLGGRLAPAGFGGAGAGRHAAARATYGPAVIDDDTPPPAHARTSRTGLATVALAGFVLWVIAYAALRSAGSPDARVYADMAGFFTKAALLTFGGAYAVLPYVYQGAVEHYGWLTGPQMIDGLALGETTPGPLIMIVAFVGFVGGWTLQALGPDALVAAGIAGAVVATFFTFLPSFVFILAGGPLVERTRGSLRVAAPLAGISAAVVGVIASLALFFARHVLWPDGTGGRFDAVAAAIGVAAAVAVFRFRVGVVPLILGCGALGLALRWAGLH